jgi:ABC-type cobalamin/Fe3+-siderophores transport system ATPase subunit
MRTDRGDAVVSAHLLQVLLLDEPTSALDMHQQFDVMRHVRSLAQDKGMRVFTAVHNLNLASKFADKIAILAKGTLPDFGPVAEVLTPTISRQPSGSKAASKPVLGAGSISSSMMRCSRLQAHFG